MEVPNKHRSVVGFREIIEMDLPEWKKMSVPVIPAKAIGAQAGVDEVIAGVLPDGKESVIRQLQKRGKVAMVGDGINDAPALTRADIGIAIGAGADVAIDAADVVLMQSKLTDVSTAVRLSRATLRNIHENLFWAFFYNSIGIPIAAGVLYHWGILLNPMIGAAAMSLSSFCVVTNALRLNLFKLHDASRDKPLKNRALAPAEPIVVPGAEEPKACSVKDKDCGCNAEGRIDLVMNIEGMMCEHCEAHVKKALEQIDGVAEATASHKQAKCDVVLSHSLDVNILKSAVEEAGYKVVSILSNNKKENKTMQKTMKIEGMKCPMCEKHAVEALKKLDGVTEAVASHTDCNAVVTMTKDVPNEELTKAITEAGYKVIDIQ